MAVELQHPGPGGILPARRMRIVAPWTGPPKRGRCPHPQGFMRAHMVVLPAIRIQPGLRFLSRSTPTLQGALQRSVKALHFTLGLRMPKAAPVQPDSLPHQPQRQMGLSRGRLLTPPRYTVIHQHPFRNSAALKGFLQLLPHRRAVRAAVVRQSNQIATVIVEYRQRPHRVRPSLGAFEVHLPKFVGLCALKTLRGRGSPFLLPHQIVTQKNAMDGVARQLHALSL